MSATRGLQQSRHFDPDMSLTSFESVPHLLHQVVDVGPVKRCGHLNPESLP